MQAKTRQGGLLQNLCVARSERGISWRGFSQLGLVAEWAWMGGYEGERELPLQWSPVLNIVQLAHSAIAGIPFLFAVFCGSVPVFWLTANLIHFRFDSLHPPPYLPHLHAYYKFFKYLSGAALVRVVAAAGPTMSSDCYRCHCCCWWLWLFHCNLFDFHCIKFFAPARCLPLFSWCVAIICWLSAAPALLRFWSWNFNLRFVWLRFLASFPASASGFPRNKLVKRGELGDWAIYHKHSSAEIPAPGPH